MARKEKPERPHLNKGDRPGPRPLGLAPVPRWRTATKPYRFAAILRKVQAAQNLTLTK